jgi:hypothetical protein
VQFDAGKVQVSHPRHYKADTLLIEQKPHLVASLCHTGMQCSIVEFLWQVDQGCVLAPAVLLHNNLGKHCQLGIPASMLIMPLSRPRRFSDEFMTQDALQVLTAYLILQKRSCLQDSLKWYGMCIQALEV